MDASKPVSTVPSDRLLAVNVPQIPVPATLDHDCQDTPIRKLWDVAYERLREDENEAKLIKKYENSLEKYLPTDLGSVLSSELSRREWMDAILQQKMEETQAKIWKLTLGGSEIQPTEVVQKVLGVLKLVNDFVTAAVNSNPSASLAWAGVGVLLPVSTNVASSILASDDGNNPLFDVLAFFEPHRAGFGFSRWAGVHFIAHRPKSHARRPISSAIRIKQPF
jgi:hypothetical protein